MVAGHLQDGFLSAAPPKRSHFAGRYTSLSIEESTAGKWRRRISLSALEKSVPSWHAKVPHLLLFLLFILTRHCSRRAPTGDASCSAWHRPRFANQFD